jgi:hypothetical protein
VSGVVQQLGTRLAIAADGKFLSLSTSDFPRADG